MTRRTTAKITAQHGLVYHKIEQRYVLEAAMRYYRMNCQALEIYRMLCKEIACDFEEKDSYVYSVENRGRLEREAEVLEFQGKSVLTNRGRICADKIIVVTHFPILNRNGMYFLKLYQHRSYVIGLKDAPKMDGMYVDIEKKNEDAKLFSPSRSMLSGQLFLNLAEATAGMLSFSKKRCPHLGCALKWNEQEHSWDCPCHGSRFCGDGSLLNNPANNDLN